MAKTMDRTDKTNITLLQQKPWTDKINRYSQKTTRIKVLEEILGSLRITEDYASDGNRTIESASKEILTVPTSLVHNKTVQAVMPKSMRV